MTELTVKDVYQIGNNQNNNMLKVDEDSDTEALSLNEFIDELKPTSPTAKVIAGMEELRNQVLSKSTARFFELKDSSFYDVDPSSLNYVNGSEGFVTKVIEFGETIIVKLIKFIKAGFQFIWNLIKSILGLGDTNSQKAYKLKDIEHQRKELASYLVSIGFPKDIMDIETFLDDLEGDEVTKKFSLLHSKFQKDTDYIDNLTKSDQYGDKIDKEIRRIDDVIYNNTKAIKRAVDDVYKKLSNDKLLNTDVTGLNRIIMSSVTKLDIKQLTRLVNDYIVSIYGKEAVKVSNKAFKEGMDGTVADLSDLLTASQAVNTSYLVDKAPGVITAITASAAKGGRKISPHTSVNDLIPDTDVAARIKEIYFTVALPEDANAYFNDYIAYTSLVAQYVAILSNYTKVYQNTIKAQERVMNFYYHLNADMAKFIEEGLEGLAENTSANGKYLVSQGRLDEAYTGTGFKLKRGKTSFFDSWNEALKDLNEVDALEIKRRLTNFKKQIGIN